MQAFSADFTYIRLEMFVWNRTTAAGVAYMADVFLEDVEIVME